MNDYETAPGPDPSAGDYLGDVIEETGSSHGLEPVADDYAGLAAQPYCAEHDAYRPCHWCPDELNEIVEAHPLDRALAVTTAAANHLVDFLIADGEARGWIPATGFSHRPAPYFVSNADEPDTPERALYDFEITVMACLQRHSRRLGYWLRRALDRYDRRMEILGAALGGQRALPEERTDYYADPRI